MATRDIYERGFDEDVSTDNTTACPECNGRVRTNTVETACEDCGLVIDEQQIDHRPEWRTFDDDESSSKRTGAPLTVARHDRGLSTEIGRWRDASGNQLSARKRRQLGRLRREQRRGRWRSKSERNLAHGLGEVRRIASALGLSETVRDQACQLFRSAKHEDLLRGRSIEAIAAASVYGACRCNNSRVTRGEVAERAQVKRSRVVNAYKTLNTELGLPVTPVTPQSLIPRLSSELAVKDTVRRRALELAELAHGSAIANGRQPAGVAGACLYIASREYGQGLRQTDIAEVAGTTAATLRARRDEFSTAIDSEASA
ncbi:transcription initiation factor TFB [Halogeometricum pallidum JCM 14848]|uniref:Transcription initiation factor IIB n=1 Tax=Halogeometricum pallidum JCM 14848 TaxID=1227487 RepID=M0D2Q6_HALPD|nr:transcription initiation factor IIB family protein [Halogeometricum pallidum]ELZ28967.1 transcription initiation factor TFB [Halogeometricum pallidum JCM 14848]